MAAGLRQSAPESPLLRYIIVLASVAIALLLRQALDPILGDRLPFGLFFIVVVGVAWWLGTKATLLALLLSSLAGIYLYVPPRNVFGFATIGDFLGWLIFFVVGLGSALISDARESALRELQQEAIQHQQTLADLKSKELAMTAFEETQARLAAIVEYSDDAIVSKTLEGIVVSWNKGAMKTFGYTAEDMIGTSIRRLFPPERLYEEDDFLSRLARGEHIDHFETVRVRKDGQQINISVTLSPIRDASGKIIGASKIARDITERKRHEQRTDFLLKLSTALSRALTSREITNLITKQAIEGLGASVSAISLLTEEGTALEMLSLNGTSADIAEKYRRTPLDFQMLLNEAVRTNRMIWIETQPELFARYPLLKDDIERNRSRSSISIPLRIDEKPIGGILISFPTEKRCNSDEEAFLKTLALLCGQSLERARLYEAEQRERALAEALRDTVVSLSRTWELSQIFDTILENIDSVVQHDMADIMLLKNGVARIVRSHRYAQHGLVHSEAEMENFSLTIADIGHMQWVVEQKRPWLIEDTQTHPTWVKLHTNDLIRSTLIVPILVGGEITGFLNVDSLTPYAYTLEDAEHLQVFANYAAVAIRNAQLYQQALTLAAQEERQRIARDLHDSVNQTLFSANVIAEALPRLWEIRPERARTQTSVLYELIRGATAEMRVLLVELRPESLVKTDLGELLTHLTYALPGRSDIELSIVLKGESGLLPPEVQIAFYRVAQETLNNVIKHSQATDSRIRLYRTGKHVTLTITDNGAGFDMGQVSGGIGLKSMQERAASIHAAFSVKSRVGRGTQIRLVWNAPKVLPSRLRIE